MSISVAQLEQLQIKLHNLADRLRADMRPEDKQLEEDDPLVASAKECEFPLPSPLTVATLLSTVRRKADNVQVLLARARMHEDLPPDAQAAAEQEDNLIEKNYQESADDTHNKY